MIYYSWVLWHLTHCRLFNFKSSLYNYQIYMICKHILLITFFNIPKLIFRWAQLNSFRYCLVTVKVKRPFVCLHLRGAYDNFPDSFRMGAFIDSTHMKL